MQGLDGQYSTVIHLQYISGQRAAAKNQKERSLILGATWTVSWHGSWGFHGWQRLLQTPLRKCC